MTTTRDEANTAPPVTDGAESEPGKSGGRRRRVIWLTLSAVVIAAGASAGVWLWVGGASTEPAPTAAGPVATAVVELGTLSATESWDGTLDYGVPFTVASGGEGVVTRLTGQGETVGRGDVLYRVNEQPVILLYGAVPMFRNLGLGDFRCRCGTAARESRRAGF